MVRALFVTLTIVAAGVSPARAQSGGQTDSKVLTAVGPVKSISASSLMVEIRGNEYVFVANSATRVRISTGGSPTRDLVYRIPPERPTDVVIKVGDMVSVKYRQSGNTRTAVEVEVLQTRPK